MVDKEDLFQGCCRQLGDKLRLLDRFREETNEARRALDSGETDSLNMRLKARQRLADKISRVDKEIETLMKNAETETDGCPQKIERLMRDYMDPIRDTLTTISLADEALQVMAARQRDMIKHEILEMKRGVTAARRYGAGRQEGPRFLDVRR